MKSLKSLLILLTCTCVVAFSQEFIIKFATVAPEGTAWLNIMREYDAAVRKESGGRMGFKIYFGGSQGTEQQYLRKVKIGQIHAVGVTGVGMGEVAPPARVLEAPFLVQSAHETDYLIQQFGKEFEKAFEDGGYVLLGMTDVGFVYVFTKTEIKKTDDLKSLKIWTWEGDPIPETAFKILGINPIALSLDNVRTSLQTGLIDAFYTSPLAAIGLQWHTQAKYVVDVPLTNAAGAVLISKKYFDALPKDLQEILLRNGRQYMSKLTTVSRQDNQKSLETLRRSGIKFLTVDPKDFAYYVEAGRKARRLLVGKIFSEDLLNRVEAALTEFRKNNKAAQ